MDEHAEIKVTSPNKCRPLVSALVTTWNAAEYLREAIQTILDQSYSPIEIIVVDDGSTDHTPEVCALFGDKIRYFRQDRDGKGGAMALIRAFAEARGTYLASLDHDDRWLTDKIARQVAALEADSAAGAVFTRFDVIDSNGINKGLSSLTAPSGEVFHLLLEGNLYCHSAGLFRRAVLEEVGHHDPDVGIGDWDLWLRMARRYPIIMIDEPLTQYRVHDRSYSTDLPKMARATSRVLENQRQRLHPDCPECRAGMARGMRVVAETYLQHFHMEARRGDPGIALRSLAKALRTSRVAVLNRRQMAATIKSLASASLALMRAGRRVAWPVK